MMTWFLLFAAIGGLALFRVMFDENFKEAEIAKQKAKEALEQRIDERVRSIAVAHSNTLASQKLQKTKFDPYGNADDTRWIKERQNFITKMIVPAIDFAVLNEVDKFHINGRLHTIVEQVASQATPVVQPIASQSTAAAGLAYEHLCRKILMDCGWSVQTTPATGDQGADLLISRNGVKVVVQCKDYARPVGNKAVQEVSAAKLHYRYSHAIVAARNGFTDAARQLAATNSVALVHHLELRDLARHLLF